MIHKIGHRGAKGFLAENTLESFSKALDLGANAIELDVHICATGEIVVIHDFTVDRTTNGFGEVHQLSLSELKKLKVEALYAIPLLEEVLDLVAGKCWVNVELKGHGTAEPVAELIQHYVTEKGWRYKDFVVSSFQKEELKRIKKINPEIPIGILTQASVEQAIHWAEQLSAQAIHPHFSLLTEDNCKEAQAKGYAIFTWTVNEEDDIRRVKALGVNGVISDYPNRL
ncbi:glycerophosphodiester phosphodiesterase family protein [Flavobacterium sp.]|uniref:glycerophosphodiester phosphodiesterase n=1 Tax=Flavobacterium sp. TaxID=239 RepID=UPI002629E3F7|nr:glycerophosphodiester phosphodiesterase family protein [Flavobacterium sp.]